MKIIYPIVCRWLFVSICVVGVLIPRPADGVLNSIWKIRDPSVEEKGQAVHLEAQVVRIHPRRTGFFLFDGANGIYVSVPDLPEEMKKIQLGDVVQVDGYSELGDFAPMINCVSLNIIENSPLPEGRLMQNTDRLSPSVDCDWVLVKGRVISMMVVRPYDSIMLEVAKDGYVLDVQVEYSTANERRCQELMFQWAQFPAVLGTVFNKRRQAAGRILYANGAETFELVTGYDELSVPRTLAPHELMRYGTSHRQEVVTQGVVTSVSGRELYMRGPQSSIKVLLPELSEVQLGDRVKLTGYVWSQQFGPAFRARKVEVVEHGEPPAPLRVRINGAVDPDLDGELIGLDAQVIDRGKLFGQSGLALEHPAETFLCRAGELVFEVRMPADVPSPSLLRTGARVRLSGICTVLPDTSFRWRLATEGMRVELRNLEDIVVIESAPWWTPQRFRWAMGIVSGAGLLFLAWIFSLRKTVRKQTAIISEKVERETILDERQRVARELHDNLEQGLAGAVIQLGACRKLQELSREQYAESCAESGGLLATNPDRLTAHLSQQAESLAIGFEKSRGAIDVVESMLTHCSTEARASILELRGGLLERMDLVEAIRVSVKPLALECGAALDLTVEGESFRLKRVVERNLLLVAKEAASNAARHGYPANIRLSLSFADDELRMSVWDDGCGYDKDALPNAGRFGLLGMHERINKIKGRIRMESSPGRGTTVEVVLPAVNEWRQG